jgi:hypothetical protein
MGWVEPGVAAFAVGFGVVHGDVGVADEQVRGVGGVADGDADAGVDGHGDVVDGDGLLQGGDEALRDGVDGVVVGDVFDEDGELVAAESGGGVAGSQVAGEALADFGEERVAGGVAQPVVDGFEVVEVDEQYGGELVAAGEAAQGVFDAVEEQRAVGQAGEGVVEGLVGELGFEADAFGGVAAGQDDAVDAGVAEQVGGQGFEGAPFLRGAPDAAVEGGAAGGGGGDGDGEAAGEAVDVVGCSRLVKGVSRMSAVRCCQTRLMAGLA